MPLVSLPPTPTIPDLFDDQRPQALVVVVGGVRYALDIAVVREVVRPRSVTAVPGAPRAVRGLINVRGRVVTVIELAALLDGSNAPAAVAPAAEVARAVAPLSVVLLEHAGFAVGVSVDAVHDVLPFDRSARTADAGIHSSIDTVGAGNDEVQPLDLPALLTRVMLAPEERQ